MIYCILSDSDNVEPFIEPRQLSKINGEVLIKRTIRLLKENGIKDILITSHDKRFDNLGATRYEPLFNDYKPKENKGYWLSAFPIELINEPITFLLGDVYYSENAIKTIVESKTDSVLFFCTSKKDGYSDKYIKHHDEPLGFKVEDHSLFKKKIYDVKRMKDEGKAKREPITWELYRAINGIDINVHQLTNNYIAINDETCDIDKVEDINLLEFKIGGSKVAKVRVKVKETFSLEKFNELEELVRANPQNAKDGELYVGDIFLCSKEMADYLLGKNKYQRAFIEENILEVIPEEAKKEKNASKEKEEAKTPVKKTRKRRKKEE